MVTPPPPGERFGKFVRTERIGVGGMGEVWRGFDTELQRWVALKFLRGGDAELARFEREARVAGRLAHPHIAAIHEFVPGPPPFIAMQLIEGTTLGDATDLDRATLLRLVRDAALAVHHAHRHGVIHRDLKPDNLMVTAGPSPHCYVMDFGLARAASGVDGVSRSGTVVGTLTHMPPEQVRGEPVDARADVYALGATLYDLLSGAPPFAADSVQAMLARLLAEDPAPLRTRDASIPADLEVLVMRCLEKDRERRYPTAQALADDLTRYLEGRPIEARAPSPGYRLRKWAARHRAAVAAGAGGVALALAVAAALGPPWLAARRAAAARGAEAEARERARSYLGNGRRLLEELRLLARDPEATDAERAALATRARTELDRALREDPRSAEAWLGIGQAFAADDRLSEAVEAFGRAIDAAAGFAPAHLERARIWAQRYEQLRSDPRGRVQPETPEAARIRAKVEADVAAVRAHSHDDGARQVAEGLLASAAGDVARALAHFDAYATVAPTDPDVHFWRGCALQTLERWPEAHAALARAIANAPRLAQAHARRAFVACELARHAEALADAERAAALDPELPSAHLARGVALAGLGRHGDALAAFDRALALAPKSPVTLTDRCHVHRAIGNAAAARADLDAALALDPDHWPALTNRAQLRAEAGDPDGALADADRAVTAHPRVAECRLARAPLHLRAGRLDAALVDADAALALSPSHPVGLRLRATVLLQARRLDDALATLDGAVAAHGADPRMWHLRAMARVRAGDRPGALADCERALDLAPPDWPLRARVEAMRAQLRSSD